MKQNRGLLPGEGCGVSVIGAAARVVGDVFTSHTVVIEGSVLGNVRAEGKVLVAEGGRVDGSIEANEAVIAGEVCGPMRVYRLTIRGSAVVNGSVKTGRFAIEEGAALDVELSMEERHQLLHRGAA